MTLSAVLRSLWSFRLSGS